MSGWLEWCREELERVGAFDPSRDFYEGETGKAVIELCRVFEGQHHSGLSANVIVNLFWGLVNNLPLTPLTGEDNEWIEISPGIYQNKRCPSVFKDETGIYQSDYYIFKDETGASYISRESRRYIKEFPYYPRHDFIQRNEGVDNGKEQ